MLNNIMDGVDDVSNQEKFVQEFVLEMRHKSKILCAMCAKHFYKQMSIETLSKSVLCVVKKPKRQVAAIISRVIVVVIGVGFVNGTIAIIIATKEFMTI
jgi:hypothetical protein